MSDRQTKDSVQKLAGTFLADHVTIVDCTILSVDPSARTCNVIPIGGTAVTEIESVLLMTTVDDGLFISPAIGSTVKVTIPKKSNPFVSMFSEIDTILFVTLNGIQLQGDEYGGVVIAPVLLAALNALQTFASQPLTTITELTNSNVKHGS